LTSYPNYVENLYKKDILPIAKDLMSTGFSFFSAIASVFSGRSSGTLQSSSSTDGSSSSPASSSDSGSHKGTWIWNDFGDIQDVNRKVVPLASLPRTVGLFFGANWDAE
jgi:hypothetical protein